MKPSSSLLFLLCAALLCACGSDTYRSDVPPSGDKPPVAMTDAFTASVTTSSASMPDDAEPVSIDAVSVTAPEDAEPVAL